MQFLQRPFCSMALAPLHSALHASNESYGIGWDCARGYRQAAGRCVAVVLPPNAYLDRAGSAWSCERGFRQQAAACVAMVLPLNAYLDYTGNDWSCDDGFQKQRAACAAK